MSKQRGPPKGPLTEREVDDRLYKQIQVIEDEANKEINIMSIQSAESREVLAKELSMEPKEQIDEWVEKVRAYTERQTMIHAARLRRIAKLQVLEAFLNIRELIKDEARERIREKMTGESKECHDLIGRMLYQGLLRLMESTVLVHSTRTDIKKVEKHYAWAIKKYQDETNIKLKLVTSKHPLKSSYYGTIVLSDKKSTIFVDVNLHKNVDKIADEVFTHEAAVHGKYKNPLNLDMKHLRVYGFKIMPRGKNITSTRLDILISTMHGDPRTQMPTICLKEESKKYLQEPLEPIATSPPARLNRRKVTLPYVTPPPQGGVGGNNEPVMSVIPAKYMFRQTGQDDPSEEELSRNSRDLYNLDNEISSMELSSHTDVPPGAGQSAVWKNMPTIKPKSFAKSRPPKAMPRLVNKRDSQSPEKNLPGEKSGRDNDAPSYSTKRTDDGHSEGPSRPSTVSGSTISSDETTHRTFMSETPSRRSSKEKNHQRK